ncbi:hypothetical protein C0708_22510 [Aeromonas caviae]|nr:hypothetical protein C0708_22510 [Aeromonas caviae]
MEVPVSGSPSEVKVTAQVTDQAATRPGLLTTRPRWTTWRPRRRAWNCKAPCRRHLQQGRDGDDNSVTAKVTLSAGTQVGDLLVVKDARALRCSAAR